MSSATIVIFVPVAVGVIAGLVIYILLPPKPPLPPEQAINDSIIAQQWAGVFDHPYSPATDLPMHGGIG